ncbi:ATP-binding cassette domain-containing protein [Pseudoduganella sp. DS3]|uniref:ATP-binding cassette domain-containing protein n=1 Tax=Pseudoduganella guangdongensis TaxID=2692179 RepID=A0A6N9HEM4_9BURK|nr:ABC transporter ATP-binding protein [Pseudoduganella guangdongensis]MYN01906.1 ATP-binding cassette domain-containing protein [Pseudoduganella guangdongensis]
MPILDLQQISYAFGSHTVVDRLSLQLAAGSIACLLGPSGCGKTTVLRCIAGFEHVAQGSIVLEGEIVARPGLHVAPELRRVGMVFQDYALFPHLTVAENIGFGLARSERAARVASLLQTVGLAGQGSRYPHELSGGQQQRVALARALAPRPRLLLLDEPFSNLDVELRERLAQEVRQILRAEGVSAILVTHDQHEAFAFADLVGVMHEGRIQQWDAPYNLYHRPANRFVADFVGQGVFLPGEVQADGRIKLELGSLPAQGERGTPGQQMQVLLRPDDVLHDDASTLTAEVVAKTFRGAEFMYTLRLASGAQVLSLVPSHHNHALGERIGIVLGAEHVVAFAAGA